MLSPNQSSQSPEPHILHKTPTYTLSCTPWPHSHQYSSTLTLTLQIPSPSTQQITIYDTIIQADSEIGRVLDGLVDLVDYLEDSRNVRVGELDGSVVVVSRTEVKGKEKEIEVCRIGMTNKRVVKMDDTAISPANKIQHIRQICSQPKPLKDSQIRQFFSQICHHLLKPPTAPTTSTSTSIPTQQPHSSMQAIITKIIFLGREQQLIKDKIAGCNQKTIELENEVNQAMGALGKRLRDNEGVMETVMKLVEEGRLEVAKMVDFVEKELEEKIVDMSTYLRQKYEQMSEQILTIRQSMKQHKMVLPNHNTHSLPRLQSLPQSQKYIFSATLKHKSIKLLTPYHAQGIDNTRSKICLITPSINPPRYLLALNSKQEYSIRIRIVHDASDVLVGVAEVDRVRALGFGIQSWGSGNHGGYYINSGGYLYSYFRKDDNDILKSFTFRDGDIIQITLSEAKKCIIFRNRGESCVLEYDESVKADKLHFCVVLHKNTSRVEIVD